MDSKASSVVKKNSSTEPDEVENEIFPSRESIQSLERLIEEYRVPASHPLLLAGPGSRACNPPARYMAMSASRFKAGLRFPVAPFFKRVINACGLSPFQLTPSSYEYLTSLYLLCKSSGRPAPSTALVKSLFHLKASPSGKHEGFYALCGRPSSQHKELFSPLPLKAAPYSDQFFFAGGDALAGINTFDFARCPAKWNKPHELPVREKETLQTLLGLSLDDRRRRADRAEVRLIRYKIAPGPLGEVEFNERELLDPEEKDYEDAVREAEVGEAENAREDHSLAGLKMQKMSGRPSLKYNIGGASQPRPQREETSSRQVVQPGDGSQAAGRVPTTQTGMQRGRDKGPEEGYFRKKYKGATAKEKGKNPLADTHRKQLQQQEDRSSAAHALWTDFSKAVIAMPSKKLFSHTPSAVGSGLSQLISNRFRDTAVMIIKQSQEVQELEKTASNLQTHFADAQQELELLKSERASHESSLEAAKKELEDTKIAFDNERVKTSKALIEVGKLWTVFGQSQAEAVSWQEKYNKLEAELSEERNYVKEAVEKANTAVEWVVAEMYSHFPDLDYSFNSDFAKICDELSKAKPVSRPRCPTKKGPRVDGAHM